MPWRVSAACSDSSPLPDGDTLYRRIEINHLLGCSLERAISDGLPDSPPLEALRERMGDIRLEPSLSVVNDRHTLILSSDDESRFELVLDDVTFSGPRGEVHIRELEVESLSGSDDELRAIARWLTGRFELEPAGPSKYIRGMELVG